jgi:uncharacterized protein GlcG (DUF336 family)
MSLVKLEQALGVAQFVVRNANAPVSVFVADDHGEVVAAATMDGAAHDTRLNAQRKAYTAARSDATSTAALAAKAREDAAERASFDPFFTFFQGGVAAFEDGRWASPLTNTERIQVFSPTYCSHDERSKGGVLPWDCSPPVARGPLATLLPPLSARKRGGYAEANRRSARRHDGRRNRGVARRCGDIEAHGHGWTRVHDQDAHEADEGRQVHARRERQVEHSQLSPQGPGRERQDERGQDRHEVFRDNARQGQVHVRVRPHSSFMKGSFIIK